MQIETVSPIPGHYRDIIKGRLEGLTRKNSSYSQSAFARDLGISPAYLSEVLSGKSKLSTKKALEISQKLNLPDEDQKLFIKLVEIANSDENSKLALERQLYNFDSSKLVVSNELYSSISQWHSLALLELISLNDFQFDMNWIAKKLAITEEEALSTLNNLLTSKLVTIEQGKLVKKYDYFVLPNGNNAKSAFDFHKNLLNKAAIALDEQKSEERNFTGAFLHIKKEDIGTISEKIKIFRREIAKEFESEKDSDSIYMFSIQLFRVDKEVK